jgi:serine/threonine protein phosphatase PrpC
MFGIITEVNAGRKYGWIQAADSRFFTFLFSDYRGPEQVTAPQPVEFVEKDHPHDRSRKVAAEVRPAANLQRFQGRVTDLFPKYGFIRLNNGRSTFFSRQCMTLDDLEVGELVECTVVPGRDYRLFAMSVERTTGAQRQARAKSLIAAASQRGTRHSKWVNDDGFLVQPLAGDLWVLAVADGVSRPEYGWWASDKCLELLALSAAEFGERLLAGLDHGKEVVRAWMNEVHDEFLSERRRQVLPDYQSATSTLTFAVVNGLHVLFANSGDTPLYQFVKARNKLKALTRDVWGQSRDSKSTLIQHMGLPTRTWRPSVGEAFLAAGDLAVVCSDGVMSGDNQSKKQHRLESGLSDDRRPLQERAQHIVAQIVELGEQDDLTLVAFRP